MDKEKELTTSMKCIKYMFCVANFMFVLVGLLLMLIGLTVKAIYDDYDRFLTTEHYSASTLAVIVGVMIFFVALYGCFGALRESVCLINMYALMLICILVLEVTVSCVAYSMRSRILRDVEKKMIFSLSDYEDDSNYIWNAMQSNLQCCGVTSPDDWYNFDEYDLENVTDYNVVYRVPRTCCRRSKCININWMYKVGCLDKVIYIISESALLLGVGAMSVACIQLMGVIFAYLLAKSVRNLKTQILVERTNRRQQLYENIARAQQDNTEKSMPVLYIPSSSEA